MPTIGELVIDIKASTASIQTDMTKLQGTMASSSAAIVSSLNKIVDVMILDIGQKALRGLASMVEKTIEAGDRIGRLSIQTGLSTEALSRYGYAAKMADIDIETFAAGMSRLSFKLEEAATSNKKLRADFAAFGIDATKIRDPEQALIKLNEAFNRLYQGDKARVIAASIEFFSRAGFRLLPFLTMAPTQVRAFTTELEQMGGVWDKQGVATAESLHENFKRLDTAAEIFGKRLVETAGPAIEKVTAALIAMTKNADVMRPVLEGVGKLVVFIAGNFGYFAIELEKTVLTVDWMINLWQKTKGGMGAALKELATGGSIYSAGAALAAGTDWTGLSKDATDYLYKIDQLTAAQEQLKISMKDPKLSEASKKFLDVMGDSEAATNKQAAAIDALIKKIDDEAAAYGKTKDQILLMQAIEAGASEAQLNHITGQMNRMDEMARRKAAKGGVAEVAAFYGPLAPAQMNEILGITQQMIPATNELDEAAEKARDTMFGFYKGALTWEEQWALKTEQIVELWRLYPELGDMAAKAIEAQNAAWDEHNKKTSILVAVQRDISQGFADALFGADSFGDAMQRLLLRIAEVIFQAKVLDPLLQRLFNIQAPGAGGGGGGGLFGMLGGFFGGLLGLQGGGSFRAGQPFLAGESGPEIVYPGISGAVIPNHALGGNTYNIDARGADPTVEFRIRRALRESEQRSVARSVSTTREIGLRNIT